MPSTPEKYFIPLGETEAYLDTEKRTLTIGFVVNPLLKCSTDSEIFDDFVEFLDRICEYQLPAKLSHRSWRSYYRMKARKKKPVGWSKHDPDSVVLDVFAIGMGPLASKGAATLSGLAELRRCILDAKKRGEIGSMKA